MKKFGLIFKTCYSFSKEGFPPKIRFQLCEPLQRIETHLKIGKGHLYTREMEKLLQINFYPPLSYFNEKIRDLSSAGEVKLAFDIFSLIKSYNYTPDDVIYCYLIEGCLEEDDFHKAFNLLVEAYLSKVTLDLHLFERLIFAAKLQHHSYINLIYMILKRQMKPNTNIMKKLFKLAFKFEDTVLLTRLEKDSVSNPNLDLQKIFQNKERPLKNTKKNNEKDDLKDFYMENDRRDYLRKGSKNVELQIIPKNTVHKLLNLQKKGKLRNLAMHLTRNGQEDEADQSGMDNYEDSQLEEEFSESNTSSSSSDSDSSEGGEVKMKKDSDSEELKLD